MQLTNCNKLQESKCSNEMNKWWWNLHVSNLSFDKTTLLKENTVTCKKAIDMLKNSEGQPLLISSDDVHVKGVIVLKTLMSKLISGAVKYTDFVEMALVKQYTNVNLSTTLGQLSRILEHEPYAVIVDDKRDDTFVGIINQLHILSFIANSNDKITSNNCSTN